MRYTKNLDIIIISIILLISKLFFQLINSTFYNKIEYIIYLIFIIYILIQLKKEHIRLGRTKYIQINMLLFTIAYLIIYYVLGFFIGFNNNIYDTSISGIIYNIKTLIIPIICIELIRHTIINSNEKNTKIILIISIMLILLEINYGVIKNIYTDSEKLFKYIVQIILPAIALNMSFVYIVQKGGYKTTLSYRIPRELFFIIIPFYPSNWFLEATTGIVIPALIYFLFKFIISERKIFRTSRNSKSINKVGLITSIVVSIFIIAFMLGLFKYEPIAILSNSMHPVYNRGDAIIYEKLSDTDLKKIEKNSIILYRIDNQSVAHRVVNVIQENGSVKYQTKGDNNNAPDMDLVDPSQIQGVYVFHIKYIGYPSVWLNDLFNHQEAKVETK